MIPRSGKILFLPGKSHGQRRLVGYSPLGHKRVRHDLATKKKKTKKRLDAPTERHKLAQWIQKQTPIYAVYKRPTSDLGTHID